MIDETPTRIAADVGENVTIKCGLSSYPQPLITWKHNQQTIKDDKYITTSNNHNYTSKLIIHNLNYENYGDYVCSAGNAYGAVKSIIRVERKGPPQPSSSPSVLDKGDTWLMLEWIPGFNGGYSDVSYTVSSSSGATKTKEHNCHYENPCNITNLHTLNTYTFKVNITLRYHLQQLVNSTL